MVPILPILFYFGSKNDSCCYHLLKHLFNFTDNRVPSSKYDSVFKRIKYRLIKDLHSSFILQTCLQSMPQVIKHTKKNMYVCLTKKI